MKSLLAPVHQIEAHLTLAALKGDIMFEDVPRTHIFAMKTDSHNATSVESEQDSGALQIAQVMEHEGAWKKPASSNIHHLNTILKRNALVAIPSIRIS